MIKTNVADIKARLSEYLDRALAGERVVICRHNKPVAELRAFEDARVDARPIGPLPGRPTFAVAPEFFDPLPDDEIDLWEGNERPHAATPDRRPRTSPRVAETKTPLRPGTKRTRGRRRT
jgi:antitoxin (DNA-binding transcriptional repressor) of toxin-antitoxin stability system